MKKIFYSLLFLTLLAFSPMRANADVDFGEQTWEDMAKFNMEWDKDQTPVTDEEFEKVMQRFEKKKKVKKYEFEANEARDSLNDMSILKEIAEHSPTILFPVQLHSFEGDIIPAGYYKLSYQQKDNKHFIVVSQGRKVYATLEMENSNENFARDSIQFAELKQFDEEKMRLIYGNLDLNLVKDLYFMN